MSTDRGSGLRWPPTGPLVVFDLEFTAWQGSMQRGWSGPGEHREVVAIGAVKLSPLAGLPEIAAFSCLVRPRINPQLSEYFVSLTGLTQAQVDAHGMAFPEALAELRAFIGPEVEAVFSNGGDEQVLLENCRLTGIDLPIPIEMFHDLRPALARASGAGMEEVDSSRLGEKLGFVTDGRAHDALDDARAVAEALRRLPAALMLGEKTGTG